MGEVAIAGRGGAAAVGFGETTQSHDGRLAAA